MSPPTVRRPACIAITIATASALALVPPAEGKAHKCKRGQVVVRVNKRSVCKRKASVVPAPKAGDARVAFVKFALAPGTSKVPGRRGRRIRSFARLGKTATVARRSILRLLPKVLAKADAARVGRAAAVPRAAGGCAALEKPSTYTSHDGGSTMTASMGADGMSIGFDGTTSEGITIHFTYLSDAGCFPIQVPACPQASGRVDAHGTKADDVIIEATQHGKVFSYTRVKGARTDTATGQNAADAKLDRVSIDDVLSSAVTVEGKGFPRTTFSGSFRRTSTWDMRVEAYRLDQFDVKIAGNIQVDEDVAGFSSRMHEILSSFRRQERDGSAADPVGWSKPASGCATVDWSPASDSLKPKKGETGSFTGTIKAKTGGTAADGVTKLAGQSNGTFSPSEVKGATPSFSYSVTADEGVLSATVDVTSTAGAGSGEWHQPILKSDSPNRIYGTYSGEDHPGTLLTTWSGTATWKRAKNLDEGNTSRRYYLESATYTAVVSGRLAPDGCAASGSKTFSFSAQPTQPTFTILNPAADVVFGTPDKDWVLPFTTFWSIIPPPGESNMTYTTYDCPNPPDDGTEYQRSISALTAGHEGTTADGVTFAGSRDFPGGGETWSFNGID
jgi:hypothetical protein